MDKQDLSDPTNGCVTDVSQRAQLQAFLLNHFRACWRYEYLREYHRITGNKQLVNPGDIVLVHDKSPRNTWKLAIVEELMTGKDRLLRAKSSKDQDSTRKDQLPFSQAYPIEGLNTDCSSNR